MGSCGGVCGRCLRSVVDARVGFVGHQIAACPPFVTVTPIPSSVWLNLSNFNLVKKIRFFGMYGIVIHILAGLFLLKHFASRKANHAIPSSTRLARYRQFSKRLRHRSQH